MLESFMKELNSKANFLKSFLVTLLAVWGFFSAFNALFVAEKPVIQPQGTQVLAASTFQSVDTLVPSPRTVSSLATTSAQPVEKSNFEVNLPVLMYHRIRDVLLVTDRSDIEFSVAPSSLEEQLKFLHTEGYQTISLSELQSSFETNSPLPRKSVILTFDDGFRDFYTNAFPLLKKYNLRAVAFYVGGYSNFPGYMDLQMLREVHASGLVDVQAHSMGHLQLSKLKPEEQRQEIFDSKSFLEEALGKKVNYFAYPYGDFDQAVLSLVGEAGYKLAFGTTPGTILRSTERLALPRITISGFDDLKRFQQKLGVTAEEEKPNLPQTQKNETTTSAESKVP